jgi:hypothetical protein
MDIDRAKRDHLCFNCGKPGHMRNKCPDPPKRTFNARLLAMDLTEEEQLALFTEITAAPETAEEEETAPHDEEKEEESLIDLDF